jgi:hypothetical protein
MRLASVYASRMEVDNQEAINTELPAPVLRHGLKQLTIKGREEIWFEISSNSDISRDVVSTTRFKDLQHLN